MGKDAIDVWTSFIDSISSGGPKKNMMVSDLQRAGYFTFQEASELMVEDAINVEGRIITFCQILPTQYRFRINGGEIEIECYFYENAIFYDIYVENDFCERIEVNDEDRNRL